VSISRRTALAAALGLTGHLRLRAQSAPAAATAPKDAPLASLSDFETRARERVSHMAYEYVAGGAGDEITLRENRAAFERLRLKPRVLVDVSKLDTTVTLFGEKLRHPILLAPTAYHRLVHDEGELASVRGAAAAGAVLVASSSSTTSIERMGKAATGPMWFQLYVQPDRGFTRELVERAQASGCRALCVTVDAPVLGARNRETRSGFKLPPGLERENLKKLGADLVTGSGRPAEGAVYSSVLDPTVTWKDIDWLLKLSRVPVLLKGVLTKEDAATAVKAGVAGLIVSNHGGRNLDTVPATIDALPRVVDAAAGRMPILVDGGVRRGTDVLKAIARGANAVLIGRPYLYGLAVGGADGVTRVVNILRAELEGAMALTGRRSLAEIDRGVLWDG